MPQSIIATAGPLGADQQQRLQEFVNAHVGQLRSGPPERMTRARTELSALPGRPGATESFLRQYAAIVRPALAEILKGDDTMRAVNAVIVLRSLRTPEAVEMLLVHIDPAREPRFAVRQQAMSSLNAAIAATPISPAQVDAAVRQIAAAAAAETEWTAVVPAFELLGRIAALPRLPAASADLALAAQTDLLKSIVDRLNAVEAPSPLMNAAAQGLVAIRNQFTTMPASQARTVRRRLVPLLVSLNQAIAKHWAQAQEDAELRQAYGSAVAVSELLLKLAATTDLQQELTVSLARHWDANDAASFSADLKKAEALAPKFGRPE